MENPLVVFISSIMNPKKDDLLKERNAAKESINLIPITRSWRFEDSPASSERVDLSYLSKVRECDIFLMLLRQEITEPVEKEYMTAKDSNKPRLVFLKKGVNRSQALQDFINKVDRKYKEFETPDDLKEQIKEAVCDELIRGYRKLGLSEREKSQLETFKAQINTGGGDVAMGGSTIDKRVDRSIHIGGNVEKSIFTTGDENIDENIIEADLTSGVNITELNALLDELRNGLNNLNLTPKQQKLIERDVVQLENEIETEKPDKSKVAGILSSISDKLEMAGVVLNDMKAISEPLVKIAKIVGVAGITIGGLIL